MRLTTIKRLAILKYIKPPKTWSKTYTVAWQIKISFLDRQGSYRKERPPHILYVHRISSSVSCENAFKTRLNTRRSSILSEATQNRANEQTYWVRDLWEIYFIFLHFNILFFHPISYRSIDWLLHEGSSIRFSIMKWKCIIY